LPLCVKCGGDLSMNAQKCPACGYWSEDALLKLLKDADPRVRKQAASDLIFLVPSERMVLALAKALRDVDAGVRQEAGLRLFICGNRAGAAIPELIAALDDAEIVVQRFAAAALAMIGPPARSSLPRLAQLRGTADEKLKAWILEAERTISG
jgi:HEAT repeat protein